MSVIYEPQGRAREYSPLACNLYIGCNHGCAYCFAPACMRKKIKEWHENYYPRKDIISQFEKEAAKLVGDKRKILFSFLSDPYQAIEAECHLTRMALRIVEKYELNNQILTKGAYNLISADFELMKRAKTELGITLCFSNDQTRKKWEPNASSVEDRFKTLKEAHDLGISTWVSLEPVIIPEEALEVIKKAHTYVDFWKVGKLNHMPHIEATVDWGKFAQDVQALLISLNAKFYIKDDLRKFLKEE